MALGGTSTEYDRKFSAPVVTRINQTDEEQAILEHSTRIEALETWETELQNCLENATDEKDKKHLELKIARNNQRLKQLKKRNLFS